MEGPRDTKLNPSPIKKLTAVDPIKSPVGSTTNVTRPSSSCGIKLSANMSSQAQQDFLLRLEEWRKQKRETMAKSLANKPNNLKKILPVSNKSATSNTIKSNNQQSQPGKSRETVFERLYRNEKVTRSIPGKPVQNDVKILSTEGNRPTKDSQDENNHSHSETFQSSQFAKTETNNENQPNPPSKSSINSDVDLIHEGYLPTQDRGLNDLQQSHNDKQNQHVHSLLPSTQGVDTSDFSIQNEPLPKEENNQRDDNTDETRKEDCSGMVYPNPQPQNFIPPQETPLPVTKKDNQPGQVTTAKPAFRRSISMLYRQKKSLLRTTSEKNLHELQTLRQSNNHPKTKTLTQKKVLIKPFIFSPKIKKETTTTALTTKLDGWLKANGHSLENYRHLRCFGIDQPTTPARQVSSKIRKTQTNSPPRQNDDKENVSPAPKNHNDDPKPELWLKELFKLIVDLKYPSERCEEWLAAIRTKCPSCTELPIYWECLSAFRKDANNAANDDNEPDATLAEMFDKMLIKNEKSSTSKPKLEKGINPENIFQSTVVKFAVQSSKAGKESSQDTCGTTADSELVATPVRRSSRIKTPAKGTVDSLSLLSSDVSNKVTFKTNRSLLSRF